MSHVFGEVYASLYDAFYREKDYDGEVGLLRRLFDQYGTAPVRSVLDLGCGTGNHAVRLAAAGYQVVGVDRSQDMLAIAKAKEDGHHGRLRFVQGDIQNLTLGEMFDAAIMMFAVLSYQISDSDVEQGLRTARRHLRPHGLLFFDVWYGPAVVTQGPERRTREIRSGGETWFRTSSGNLDRARRACRVQICLQRHRSLRCMDETAETHTVRYFGNDEIAALLKRSGFELLHMADFPHFSRPPDSTTWNIACVAMVAPHPDAHCKSVP